ncbi:jg3479 [Pararge aegeria aegeria]|uniref:Jg3479 protein n=1 Tax=Pararge aegeria aegeria TaxID=348720 RepID=A0A8S4R539_9NEOP|nr:jg3479 [Pararge aegeria aegeria]
MKSGRSRLAANGGPPGSARALRALAANTPHATRSHIPQSTLRTVRAQSFIHVEYSTDQSDGLPPCVHDGHGPRRRLIEPTALVAGSRVAYRYATYNNDSEQRIVIQRPSIRSNYAPSCGGVGEACVLTGSPIGTHRLPRKAGERQRSVFFPPVYARADTCLEPHAPAPRPLSANVFAELCHGYPRPLAA